MSLEEADGSRQGQARLHMTDAGLFSRLVGRREVGRRRCARAFERRTGPTRLLQSQVHRHCELRRQREARSVRPAPVSVEAQRAQLRTEGKTDACSLMSDPSLLEPPPHAASPSLMAALRARGTRDTDDGPPTLTRALVKVW